MGWPEERRCSRRTEKRVARPWQPLRRRPRQGSRRAPVGRSHPRGRPILNRPARRGSVAVKAVGQSPAQAAADQAFCLRAQELRPAGADPPRRRPQVRAAQHVRDRGRRDADAQPFQLTLDTHVAPPRVLSCQPRDQAACLGGKRWTTEPATRSPIAPQQHPMPAAKRLRADRKTRPALRRKQPTRCGEQRSVGGRVMRPLPSAPEDGQLMAQHDDLKFALAAAADERAKKTAEEPVRQRHQHDRQSESTRRRSPVPPSTPNRISLPHTVAVAEQHLASVKPVEQVPDGVVLNSSILLFDARPRLTEPDVADPSPRNEKRRIQGSSGVASGT
jgi:hypothetical protein